MEPVDEYHAISLELTEWINREFNSLKLETSQWELPEYVV
jgi:hypothetical protein